jgi:hypothetical protein
MGRIITTENNIQLTLKMHRNVVVNFSKLAAFKCEEVWSKTMRAKVSPGLKKN